MASLSLFGPRVVWDARSRVSCCVRSAHLSCLSSSRRQPVLAAVLHTGSLSVRSAMTVPGRYRSVSQRLYAHSVSMRRLHVSSRDTRTKASGALRRRSPWSLSKPYLSRGMNGQMPSRSYQRGIEPIANAALTTWRRLRPMLLHQRGLRCSGSLRRRKLMINARWEESNASKT